MVGVSDSEVLLDALKLVFASASPEAMTHALALASHLAEFCKKGIPLTAQAIAAGIIREAFPNGHPGGKDVILNRLGSEVNDLYIDLVKAGKLPSRVDLYDDEASSAIRELCLTFYDVRATAVEVVSRLQKLQDSLESMDIQGVQLRRGDVNNSHNRIRMPNGQTVSSFSGGSASLQIAALEALQIYAPIGHALGLNEVATQLEDLGLQILFPASYAHTAHWLEERQDLASRVLEQCSQILRSAVTSHPEFYELASDLKIYCRLKSTHSTLKKLISLGDMKRGGRSREEIHDLIAMRVVICPRNDEQDEEAEILAEKACYLVQNIAHSLWRPKKKRSKDYIRKPKANGYQSLHSTVDLSFNRQFVSEQYTVLELQIRTLLMHERAESGEAAHGAYKGGLDAAAARQLQVWTQKLLLGEEKNKAIASKSSAVLSDGINSQEEENQFGLENISLSTNVDDDFGQLCSQNTLLSTDSQRGNIAAEALFRSLDLNSDGKISLEELRFAAREMGLQGADEFSNAESIMSLADTNEDGSVSLEEFLKFQKYVGQAAAASVMDEYTLSKIENIDKRDELSSKCEPQNFVDNKENACNSYSRKELSSPACSLCNTSIVPCVSSLRCSFSERESYRCSNSISNQYSSSFWKSPSMCICKRTRFKMHAFLEGHRGDMSNGDSGSSIDEPFFPSSSASKFSGKSKTVTVAPEKTIYDSGESFEDRNGKISRKNSPVDLREVEKPTLKKKPDRASAQIQVQQAWHGLLKTFGNAVAEHKGLDWELVPLKHQCWISTQSPMKNNVQNFDSATIDGDGLPLNLHHEVKLLNASGQTLSLDTTGSIALPQHGPVIIGAVLNKDCDYVVDAPTVSGRHARLEMVRLQSDDLKSHKSKLVLMDLGSTNGTWVNRTRIVPFKEVSLYPGDVVCFAEMQYAFEVQLRDHDNSNTESTERLGPSVKNALEIASSLEASAAASGIFAPARAATDAYVGDLVRELTSKGEYQTAYMLLLGGVMTRPCDPGLWAQLAAMERQRARRKIKGSSMATSRSFFRASVECFEAELNPSVRRGGLARVLLSWGQMEFDTKNYISARLLFKKALKHSLKDPGNGKEGAKILFAWASREWRIGDAPLAVRLCNDALDLDPSNVYVMTLLANINVATGSTEKARTLYKRASKLKPSYVTALQCWARMESRSRGGMPTARRIFRRALSFEPENRYVLQAWAVAESGVGRLEDGRRLLQRCTSLHPNCIPAWHALAKIEESSGNVNIARDIYNHILQLKGSNVETWSALGRLERSLANDRIAASIALIKALELDPKHAPSLQELAILKRLEGDEAEAYRLEKKVKRINAEKKTLLSQAKKYMDD